MFPCYLSYELVSSYGLECNKFPHDDVDLDNDSGTPGAVHRRSQVASLVVSDLCHSTEIEKFNQYRNSKEGYDHVLSYLSYRLKFLYVYWVSPDLSIRRGV